MSFGAPSLENPCEYSHTVIFLETRIIDVHYAADTKGLSSFNFWWAP